MGNNGSGYANSDSPPLGSTSSDPSFPPSRQEDEFRQLTESLPAEFSSKYQPVSKVGSGSFGDVYKVRDKTTKAIYAAKVLNQQHHNTQSEVHVYVCVLAKLSPTPE